VLQVAKFVSPVSPVRAGCGPLAGIRTGTGPGAGGSRPGRWVAVRVTAAPWPA